LFVDSRFLEDTSFANSRFLEDIDYLQLQVKECLPPSKGSLQLLKLEIVVQSISMPWMLNVNMLLALLDVAIVDDGGQRKGP
jgi:hypothetical protein